jgi:alpha-amylase
MKKIVLIYFLLLSSCFCEKHTKEEWKSISIYQLLTDRFASTDDKIKDCTELGNYCGGTFKGIIQHLDYIKGMGFNAIWISPPLKNKEGSYHGYHNIDIYNINEHFGTKDELKQLIDECHLKDIWVILDAVPNHMAGDLDISTFIPFNQSSHYHNLTDADCDGHWNEQYYKENCRIYGMPDLAQENEYVRTTLKSWLQSMINDYDFDGIRYADVPNVPKLFWGEFTETAQTYTLGIVGVDSGTKADVEYIADYQKYMDGVGNYPLFYTLRSSLCNQNLTQLDEFIKNLEIIYEDPQYNGIWLGNHDKPRFLNECLSDYKDKALRNGIIFTLFFEGIPIFYYGDEQYFNGGSDPNNREVLFGKYNTKSDIYQMVKTANNVRKKFEIYDNAFTRRYSDEHYYAFTRGNVLIVISDGTPDKTKITLTEHGFKENDKLCNELNRNECVNVKDNKIEVNMEGEPKIYTKQTSNGSNGTKFIFMSFWLFALILFYL